MAITFSCNHCGKSLTTTDDKAGRKAKCPGCGEVLSVPEPAHSETGEALDDDGDANLDAGDLPDAPPPMRKKSSREGTGTQTCPMCGAENPRRARKCDACGEEFEAAEEPRKRQSEFEYAGFWLRLGAFVIDNIILNCVGGIIVFIPVFAIIVSVAAANPGDQQAIESASLVVQLVAQLFLIVMIWLYFALMESSAKQATLGKMAVGIQVCDLDGRRISFGRATGRFFGKILSGMICLIGYIMAGFTEQKQGLHDQLAGTLVVRK